MKMQAWVLWGWWGHVCFIFNVFFLLDSPYKCSATIMIQSTLRIFLNSGWFRSLSFRCKLEHGLHAINRLPSWRQGSDHTAFSSNHNAVQRHVHTELLITAAGVSRLIASSKNHNETLKHFPPTFLRLLLNYLESSSLAMCTYQDNNHPAAYHRCKSSNWFGVL